MHRAALLLAVALVLAACAERGAGSPAASDVLGEWELTDATAAGAPLPRPAVGRATLTLDGGQLGGVSFCNHYSGTYRLDGDAVEIDGLGGTEMGCEPDVMAAESAYLAALGAAGEARIDGGELVLTGGDVTLRFRRPAEVPTSELTGTDWLLDTLVGGESVSSVASGSTLRLEADGTVGGTTACRTFLRQVDRSRERPDGDGPRHGRPRLPRGAPPAGRARAGGAGEPGHARDHRGPAQPHRGRRDRADLPRHRAVTHSHSMVPGGLLVTSRVTRLTSGTSLVIRVEIFASTS